MKRARSSFFLAILIGLVISSIPGSLLAQTQTTGSIIGSVKDQSGAVLPGVDIKTEQEGTGAVHNTISSEVGTYTVPLLPPGRYVVISCRIRRQSWRCRHCHRESRLTASCMWQIPARWLRCPRPQLIRAKPQHSGPHHRRKIYGTSLRRKTTRALRYPRASAPIADTTAGTREASPQMAAGGFRILSS